jgi:hypothetical protein
MAHQMTDREIAHAYCENELWAGHPCGLDDCPHCGGDVEATRRMVNKMHARCDNCNIKSDELLESPDKGGEWCRECINTHASYYQHAN